LNAVFPAQQNRKTFAFTAAGVCIFWLANSKKYLFKLITKMLLHYWMAGLTFLV